MRCNTAQYSSNPHPQTPQQPPEPSQAQKTNSKAAKPYNHTNNPLPFQNPGSPQKDRPQNQTNKPPKPFTQATSTHIRSPSHNPHQHTSEAHLSSHISVHPKLFSQATSAHIRSSSLKSHKTVTKTPDINQPVNQSTSTNQANHLFP